MQARKYALRCCTAASVRVDTLGSHCSFCGVHLCSDHSDDVEVGGHVFSACRHCKETLSSRRPGRHEHCTCHDEEYCDVHREIEGIG